MTHVKSRESNREEGGGYKVGQDSEGIWTWSG